MIEAERIEFPASATWKSMKETSQYLFKKITGAHTALLHSRTNTIYYKLITGKSISRSHAPIELAKQEIDEYNEFESLVIQDIWVQAPSGGVVHIRISSPDRDRFS